VDTAILGLGERVILKAVRAPDGDFRPWDDVREWARGIAAELTGGGTPAGG
jgi:menaquinone-dependent protoporphyrinogen oxidase